MPPKSFKKTMINFIITFVLFYSVVLAFLYFYQRNLQYFPGGPREPIESIAEIMPETIEVEPEPGIKLQGFYWPAQEGFETIVFFHGNGQAYAWWFQKLGMFHKLGYGVLFTDYRGYGGQPGKPTEQGIYNDARSFINALLKRPEIDKDNLVFYGESLGTGVAIQMATEFPPKALVLESAYSSTADVAKSRYWMFPVDILMKDQYRSIDKIDQLTMPKYFIHGARDIIIPIHHAKKLFSAAPEPKEMRIIQDAGHNDLYEYGTALHISHFLSTISSKKQK